MRAQVVALLLVTMLAMVASHNPNKKKKFGCLLQCRDECKEMKKAKKACFLPCKKECNGKLHVRVSVYQHVYV